MGTVSKGYEDCGQAPSRDGQLLVLILWSWGFGPGPYTQKSTQLWHRGNRSFFKRTNHLTLIEYLPILVLSKTSWSIVIKANAIFRNTSMVQVLFITESSLYEKEERICKQFNSPKLPQLTDEYICTMP